MVKLPIKCPHCKGLLELPQSVRNCLVRCGHCREIFRVPRRIEVADEAISDWLYDPLRDEELDLANDTLAPLTGAHPQPARPGDDRAARSSDASAGATGAATKPVAGPPHIPHTPAPAEPPAKTNRLHMEMPLPHRAHAHAPTGPRADELNVVRMERKGILFQFPTDLLHRATFRTAFPLECVHCLGKLHLSAHLILFTPTLRDSISVEAEHEAGQLSFPQESLGNAHGQALLDRLPEVPNVPPPGNLPMPYWLCDLCSGTGEISGQIEINSATLKGVCNLLVRNLQVAMSFFAGAAGEGRTEDFNRLQDFVRHIQEDHWDALPSVVRHRLEQWYRPGADERFLAYVPDRDFARTEDGMNGLAISDRRLVWHRPPMHQELPITAIVDVQVQAAGGKEVITLAAAGCETFKRRQITLDRSGRMLLRRALAEGHWQAKWT